MVLIKRQSYNVSDSMFYDNNRYSYYYHKGKIKYKRCKDIDYIIRKFRCNILDNKIKIKDIKELIDNYDL